MAKLTPAERDRRRKRLQQEALESVAARGQFNFRLDGEDIKRLYALAGIRQKPVSALVRGWVLERLEMEETNKVQAPPWAQALERRLTHAEVYMLLALSAEGKHRDALRSKLQAHIRKHFDAEMDKELKSFLTQ